MKYYLSTIATDAVRVAREYGFGLEIAEYCTAWNMDEKFVPVDGVVKKKLEGSCGNLLHAPYNELFPCAIDKKARELASYRYRQAIAIAKSYGSAKVVIHSGVIATIMEHLFPEENKSRYQWQPRPGEGYCIADHTYRRIP